MSRLALLMLSTALPLACGSVPPGGEVVSSSSVIIFASPDHLDRSCVSRGRVAATGTSAYRLPFFDNRDIAESRAIAHLSERVRALGANTVVLDPEAEVIPLDAAREWGVHLEGNAYACDPVRPAA